MVCSFPNSAASIPNFHKFVAQSPYSLTFNNIFMLLLISNFFFSSLQISFDDDFGVENLIKYIYTMSKACAIHVRRLHLVIEAFHHVVLSFLILIKRSLGTPLVNAAFRISEYFSTLDAYQLKTVIRLP